MYHYRPIPYMLGVENEFLMTKHMHWSSHSHSQANNFHPYILPVGVMHKHSQTHSTRTPTHYTWTSSSGSSFARKRATRASRMFFQPSLKMLPCWWARENMVSRHCLTLELVPRVITTALGLCEQQDVRWRFYYHSVCLFHE